MARKTDVTSGNGKNLSSKSKKSQAQAAKDSSLPSRQILYSVKTLVVAVAIAFVWRWLRTEDASVLLEKLGLRAGEGGANVGAQEMQDQQQILLQQLPTPLNVSWRVVSKEPRIFMAEDFVTDEECEFFKKLVHGELKPAMVVQKSDNKYDLQATIRNNKQVWLSYEQEFKIPMVQHVLKRIHRAARIPDDDAEALQVGHYSVGEKYEAHLDTDPDHDVARPATMIIYLNDVEDGGDTIFPMTDRVACSAKYHSDADGEQVYGAKLCCNRPSSEDPPGFIRVKARKGRAVLFFNHKLSGEKDARAEHAACPINKGEKWIVQRWFRFKPYQRLVHPPDPRFDGMPVQGKAHLVGPLEARVLSHKSPRIYLIEDLLSEEECKHLIDLAATLDISHDTAGEIERRWVPEEVEAGDPVVSAIAKRLHRAALVPESDAEPMQLGRYEPGGKFTLHLDSDPASGVVRPLTLLVYLTGDGTEENQGATVFPLGKCRDLATCCRQKSTPQGLHSGKEGKWRDNAAPARRSAPMHILPKAGRAVLFASHTLDGKLEAELAVHGACPAGPAGKWVLQRWFRAEQHNNVKHKPDPQYDGFAE